MGIAGRIDETAQRLMGLPYLRLTRDHRIFERCRFLTHVVAGIPGDGLRFLDVGCGSGMALRYLGRPKIAQYLGIDLHATRLYDRLRGFPVPHEFQDVDLDDDWRVNPADVAWCSEVLEHLVDDTGVLRKIARSVVPGGHIILTMPSVSFIDHVSQDIPILAATSATQDGGHVRKGYTAEDMQCLASAAGCEVIKIGGATRSDVRHVAARYTGRARSLTNVYFAARRYGTDAFCCDSPDLRHYHSITAVLRRPT